MKIRIFMSNQLLKIIPVLFSHHFKPSGDCRKTLAIINYGTPIRFPVKKKQIVRKLECKIHFTEKGFSTVSSGLIKSVGGLLY
jgi:hypothetical protein